MKSIQLLLEFSNNIHFMFMHIVLFPWNQTFHEKNSDMFATKLKKYREIICYPPKLTWNLQFHVKFVKSTILLTKLLKIWFHEIFVVRENFRNFRAVNLKASNWSYRYFSWNQTMLLAKRFSLNECWNHGIFTLSIFSKNFVKPITYLAL